MDINFVAIDKIFMEAEEDGRTSLLEHEVYKLLREAGIQTPEFRFIRKGEKVFEKNLSLFKGDSLVLKVVSPVIKHKSDVGGVRFVKRDIGEINHVIQDMLTGIPKKFQDWQKTFNPHKEGNVFSLEKIEKEIRGVLICDAVDYVEEGFGSEILLGLRTSREFGPVVTMGMGGLDVEYLNEKLKEGKALSIASVHCLKKEDILLLLKPLSFFDKLVCEFRGRKALISKEELIEAYFRFAQLGAYYSPFEKNSEYTIEEAEVNPFVISEKKLKALDGLCRFSKNHREIKRRPVENIRYLLEPRSIGIVGVSERMNMGHIILNNILRTGFPKEKVFVVKPGLREIEGCVCVPTISELPGTVDVFIVTISAEQSYEIVKQICENEKAYSVIIIAGGLGEKKGTETLEQSIKEILAKGRREGKLTPVVNGGNCLGLYSRPGKYDTTFIPEHKFYELPRKDFKKSNLVYLSQSGAFMISQMSSLPLLQPLYGISVGNQIDLSITDYLEYLKDKDEAGVFAIYIEGFLPGEGVLFARTTREITREKGKRIIVYKAGKTPEAKSATTSHTASIAGDYKVSRSILEEAGVIMTENISDFKDYTKCLCYLTDKKIRGKKVGLISNAGFECVIMCDNLKNERDLMLTEFSSRTQERLIEILNPLGIDRLQDIHNPLDITPVADDKVFARCVQAIIEDENVDCAVISIVPMTASMKTLPPSEYHDENVFKKGSLPFYLAEIFRNTDKPFVVSIEAGNIYTPMAEILEREGIPTFRHCDDAVKFMREYVNRI